MATGPEIFKKNILEFNQQLSAAAITTGNLEMLSHAKPDAIVMVGMGGSGTPAHILQNIAGYATINLPLVSWKDFGLPQLPYTRPLYLFISFSGNTRETLSAFISAPSGALMAIVAGGGTLLSEAKKRGIAYATFAQGTLQPRQAYGLTLYGTLSVLKTIFPLVPLPDMRATIDAASAQIQGEDLAKNIKDTIPFIYTSSALSHIGQILKISLNESGKLLAAANVFPEINHNELSAFETKPKNASVIFITTPTEHRQIEKEIHIIRTILTEYEIPMHIVEVPGANPLETTAHSIVLAEWVGYYVATLRGLDPLGINTVNKIKELTQK